MPTATATPNVPPGPDPTLVACLEKVDPILRDYLYAQPNDQQMVYGCPESSAVVGAGYKLLFEHGYMLGFDMMPEMLVFYGDSGQWERVVVPNDAAPPPEENQDIPGGRFGWLWSQGARREELGNATAPEPTRFEAIYQMFPGAVMVGDKDSLAVTVLAATDQR
jgi:hypothetical protein